jgi:hypothetical protein
VDTVGNLKLATGYPKVVTSPQLITSGFKAGKYVGPSAIYAGKMIITVSGPGVAPGGATEWSLAAAPGADGCTYPSTATWYVWQIANSPLAKRLQNAGITSTALSYGIGNAQCNGSGNWRFSSGTLLGLSQAGNTLTILSFTDSGSGTPDIMRCLCAWSRPPNLSEPYTGATWSRDQFIFSTP